MNPVLSACSHPLTTSISADLCFLLLILLPVVSTAHNAIRSPHKVPLYISSRPSAVLNLYNGISLPLMPLVLTHVAYSFATLVNKPGSVADHSPARARQSSDMIHDYALIHA